MNAQQKEEEEEKENITQCIEAQMKRSMPVYWDCELRKDSLDMFFVDVQCAYNVTHLIWR